VAHPKKCLIYAVEEIQSLRRPGKRRRLQRQRTFSKQMAYPKSGGVYFAKNLGAKKAIQFRMALEF